MIDAIIENRLINQLTSKSRRSPMQFHRVHEADAEIVSLAHDFHLAITCDSIVEEIVSGLYSDPFLVGWMTVMSSLSDLAAVGADPIGVLVAEVLPQGFPMASLLRMQEGIEQACVAGGTYLLGGDINTGPHLMTSGMAVGSVRSAQPMTRCGCAPGDAVYCSGPLGLGNAFALERLQPTPASIAYQPVAGLAYGKILREVATACMDTSDGLIATLDQLMRLNGVGFDIDADCESLIHSDALAAVDARGIPAWLLLAGQHGEYELVFTVPPDAEDTFLCASRRQHWEPVRLGHVTSDRRIHLRLYGERVPIDTGRIRNLSSITNGSIEKYLAQLVQLDHEIRKGVHRHVSA